MSSTRTIDGAILSPKHTSLPTRETSPGHRTPRRFRYNSSRFWVAVSKHDRRTNAILQFLQSDPVHVLDHYLHHRGSPDHGMFPIHDSHHRPVLSAARSIQLQVEVGVPACVGGHEDGPGAYLPAVSAEFPRRSRAVVYRYPGHVLQPLEKCSCKVLCPHTLRLSALYI